VVSRGLSPARPEVSDLSSIVVNPGPAASALDGHKNGNDASTARATGTASGSETDTAVPAAAANAANGKSAVAACTCLNTPRNEAQLFVCQIAHDCLLLGGVAKADVVKNIT
jgi:hypothetical protein